ncbi:hypothetical protein N9Z83_02520 [Akkermansiaceae bacterium]|nr:hypothetical protein [Akkermansiaceae bacterium]
MNKSISRQLGYLCLLGCLSSVMVSCDNAETISRLNESIEGKKETIADLDARIAKEEKSLADFEKLKDIEMRYETTLKKLEKVKADLEDEESRSTAAAAAVKAASLKYINYCNQYRRAERARAKGVIIDLSSVKGPEYKDVKITRITPLEVRVLLKSGPKGVPFHELPESVRDRFQFSDEEAAAYQHAVANMQAARAKSNIVVDADKQIDQATVRATEVATAIAEKKSLIAAISRRIKSEQLEAERLESLARHWKTEENNSRGRSGRSGAAGSRAVKVSDQANQIRLGISNAKEKVLQLRHEIGQLLKGS